MGGMDLRKKTGIRVKEIIQSHLVEFSNQLNAASLGLHFAQSLTDNDKTMLKNIQAKVLDPAEKVLDFLDVINGKVCPELFIEALRKEKLYDLADKVENEYDRLTSELDRSSAQSSSASRSSERSLPSLSDNLYLPTTSSLPYSSLPTFSSVNSRASTAGDAHSETNGSGADKENLLPSLTSVSLTSSLSASAAVNSRDKSVINKQVFKRSQSDAATSTGTDFTEGSRPIHFHGAVNSVLIGNSNTISVENSNRGDLDCETDGDLASIKYEVITEEDSDNMRSGEEEMRGGNTDEDETLVKRVSQSTSLNHPARVEGAHRGTRDGLQRDLQNGSQSGSLRDSQGGDQLGHVSLPDAPNPALSHDQGRPSRSDEDQTVRGDSGEAWGTERSVAASLGVDLRPGGPACQAGPAYEAEGETKVWRIGREGDDDEDDTEIFKSHRNIDREENTKLYKLERELSNTVAGTGVKVDKTVKTDLDQDNQSLTSSGVEVVEGGVDNVNVEGAEHGGEEAELAGAHEAGVKTNYNTQDSGVSSSDSLTSNETRDSFSDDNVVEHLSRQESESRATDNSEVRPSSLPEAETSNISTSNPLRNQFLKAVLSQIIDIVK